MKKIILFLSCALCLSCEFSTTTSTTEITEENRSKEFSEEKVNAVLEDWHEAAANADFEKYFGLMTNDGVFIGTDATENWQNQEFRDFSKPHFDKGKAWSFSTLERNIYPSDSGEVVWFDELLNTQMGICRGSGVLVKEDGEWKISHYVLSIAIPNENVSEITLIKKERDSILINELQ